MIELKIVKPENTDERSKKLRRFLEDPNGKIFLNSLFEFQAKVDEYSQKNLAGKNLKRRSGNLAKSLKWLDIKYRAKGKFTEWELKAKTQVPYARLQDEGGDIKPKNSKYLAIPLPKELSEKYVFHGGVQKKRPRSFEHKPTFVAKSKAGNLIMFLIAKGKGKKPRGKKRLDKIVPLFVFKKEVTIPASNWFSDAVDSAFPFLMDEIHRRIDQGLVY
ncbi:hypothetical protein KAR91_57820 [Candidatus Pacearchaeota archaeon]|nr:hypothetical protein [Candidatus Pacearchaeota archaeon]